MKINTKILTEYDRKRIEEKYEEVLGYIEYLLIDTTSYLKIFGYFYMSLNKKILFIDNADFYKEIRQIESGFVFIEDKTLVFIVDPEILFDPKIMFRLLNKILHEILHCMLKHNSRKPNCIADAVVFNLAADHIVNSILKQLYSNKELTKMCSYIDDNEFYIGRLAYKKQCGSVEGMFDYINKSDEFIVSAKRITIPINTNMDSEVANKIYVQDVIKVSDINAIEKSIVRDKKLGLENIFDSEFNTNEYTNKVNAPIEDELYIQKSFNSFLKNVGEKLNVPQQIDLNQIDNVKDTEINKNSNDNNTSEEILFVEGISFIIIHVYDKIDEKSYHVIYDLENKSLGSDMIANEAPSQYNKYKDDLEKALSSNRSRGHDTFDAKALFDELYKVEYPWDEVLQNVVRTKSQKSDERSYTEYDIYRSHLNYVRFPGYMKELTPEVLCGVIDSSASMTDDDLNKIISILCDSIGKYSSIIVYVHDVYVKDTIYITDPNSQDEIFEKLKTITGRGGTSHKDVFEKIQELSDNNIISTLIFFTDFESDVKQHCLNYPVLNYLESIWCIFGKSDPKYQVDLPIPTMTINIDDKMFKKQKS